MARRWRADVREPTLRLVPSAIAFRKSLPSAHITPFLLGSFIDSEATGVAGMLMRIPRTTNMAGYFLWRMLLEKTSRAIGESEIPIAGVAAPLVRSRALTAGFRPVSLSDLDTLNEFYTRLDEPLADLNALMMVAWRKVLDLHLLIEDEVLYMIATWEGGPMLWGPPIGERVSIAHIRRAFQLLRQLNPEDSEPVIAYLWESYSVWGELVESDDFVAVREGTDYIFDTARIAFLAGSSYKKKRKDYKRFQEAYDPVVVEYSEELIPGCLSLLGKWIEQKSKVVSAEDREKLLIECKACEDALRDRIPLTGVAAMVDEQVRAFSIGGPHGRDCFNCMFEKTDLDFPQAPAFIFSELARRCAGSYSRITMGEDWQVAYLAASKQLWKPTREQASYYLQERPSQSLGSEPKSPG